MSMHHVDTSKLQAPVRIVAGGADEIDPRFAEAHYGHDLHVRPHEQAGATAEAEEPEDENRGMQMLAWLFLCVLGLGLALVVGVLAGCGGGETEPVQLEKDRYERAKP